MKFLPSTFAKGYLYLYIHLHEEELDLSAFVTAACQAVIMFGDSLCSVQLQLQLQLQLLALACGSYVQRHMGATSTKSTISTTSK